jgi:hypothetical protein
MLLTGNFAGQYEPLGMLEHITADLEADVFAAGGTLHFAMTGSPPFIGKDMVPWLGRAGWE